VITNALRLRRLAPAMQDRDTDGPEADARPAHPATA